jgi:hypothetical protein
MLPVVRITFFKSPIALHCAKGGHQSILVRWLLWSRGRPTWHALTHRYISSWYHHILISISVISVKLPDWIYAGVPRGASIHFCKLDRIAAFGTIFARDRPIREKAMSHYMLLLCWSEMALMRKLQGVGLYYLSYHFFRVTLQRPAQTPQFCQCIIFSRVSTSSWSLLQELFQHRGFVVQLCISLSVVLSFSRYLDYIPLNLVINSK